MHCDQIQNVQQVYANDATSIKYASANALKMQC